MTSTRSLSAAGIVGGLGVLIGAFGAHGLPSLLADLPHDELLERSEWLETGVRYHMYHAAAILALACSGQQVAGRFRITAASWLVGIVLFSGCLYAMSLTGIRVLGAVVPIGGVAFLVGWASLLFKSSRPNPQNSV